MTQAYTPGLFKRVGLSLVARTHTNVLPEHQFPAPAVGTRYQQASTHAPVWIVQTVMNVKSSKFPLVRLTSEKYPDLLKVVSLSALYDSEEFTPA